MFTQRIDYRFIAGTNRGLTPVKYQSLVSHYERFDVRKSVDLTKKGDGERGSEA
jgi:hypothetical protein